MKLKRGGCTINIPDEAHAEALGHILAIGDPMGGGALAALWQAVIEGRWADYDKAREEIEASVARLDMIRQAEPVRPTET